MHCLLNQSGNHDVIVQEFSPLSAFQMVALPFAEPIFARSKSIRKSAVKESLPIPVQCPLSLHSFQACSLFCYLQLERKVKENSGPDAQKVQFPIFIAKCFNIPNKDWQPSYFTLGLGFFCCFFGFF